MPFSTNAPFNDKGHAEVLRDIEQLYLKLQELFDAAGDLNPGGGKPVSQDNADDGLGTGTADDSAATVVGAFVELKVSGTQTVASPSTVPVTNFTTANPNSSLAGWSSGAGTFTAPADGVYLFAISASFSGSTPYLGYLGITKAAGFSRHAFVRGHAEVGSVGDYDGIVTLSLQMLAGEVAALTLTLTSGAFISLAGGEMSIARIG